MQIVTTDTIPAALYDQIGGDLQAFNTRQAGYADKRDLAVLIQDPATGATIGGALGRTSYGLLIIDLVHLPQSLRGQGLGTAILKAAEDEARARGCRAAVLFTISFQAPGFYERLGWTRFGDVPCDPPGTSRIFLSKTL